MEDNAESRKAVVWVHRQLAFERWLERLRERDVLGRALDGIELPEPAAPAAPLVATGAKGSGA